MKPSSQQRLQESALIPISIPEERGEEKEEAVVVMEGGIRSKNNINMPVAVAGTPTTTNNRGSPSSSDHTPQESPNNRSTSYNGNMSTNIQQQDSRREEGVEGDTSAQSSPMKEIVCTGADDPQQKLNASGRNDDVGYHNSNTNSFGIQEEQKQHGPPPPLGYYHTTTTSTTTNTTTTYTDERRRNNKKKKTYPRPYYTSNTGTMSRRCGSRCICPSDAWHAYILTFFIVAPVAVFFTTILPSNEWYSFLVVSIGMIGTIVCLLFSVTCDPGIQPRRLVTPLEQARVMNARHNQFTKPKEKKPSSLSAASTAVGINSGVAENGGGEAVDVIEDGLPESDEEHRYRLDIGRVSEKLVNNGKFSVQVGMCSTCAIPRPPRSGHCWHCNVCVEEFDHHCGVLGSCVAKRTFRFFAGFMYFTTLTASYAGIRTIIAAVHEVKWNPEDGASKWKLAATIGIIIYSSIVLCITLPMTLYYGQLACINSSQKQALLGGRGAGVHISSGRKVSNPYHEGYLTNFVKRMFGPLGKSKMREDASAAYYISESDEEEEEQQRAE